MNPVQAALGAQFLLALAAVATGALLPRPARSVAGGILSALLGAAAAVTGCLVLTGGRGTLVVPTSLPFGEVSIAPDALGGFFMIVAGAVGVLAAVFAIGYAPGAAASRLSWVAFPVFLLALELVPAAGDAVSFLLSWETMALASTALVLTDEAVRSEVRPAALWYSAMTQLSFVLVLAGFALLAAQGGGLDWTAMARVDPRSTSASVAFALIVAGCATKAGLVPVHVWLPRAHPAAPSHVSALMSAAMVAMGLYGAMLVSWVLLPAGPTWWGVALIVLGGVSAVYGVLQASVASDLKRLLGYSTTENVGLMFLALGAAVMLRGTRPAAATAAVLACLLLVVGHAAFKTVLFLVAGSVLQASGERDLDRMGGLSTSMPVTSAAFAVGALGGAALPVTASFVAEWSLLQALIHGGSREDRVIAVAMPMAVAVVALTAGLALLTFVKAYGVGCLARPRSAGAAAAREVGASMRAAMLVAAGLVLALGLLPGLVLRAAGAATGIPVGSSGLGEVGLPGLQVWLEPVSLLVGGAVALGLAAAVSATGRRRRRRVELAWGCGGVRASPRMQYTATSYAEPLARVFEDALRPEQDVVVTHVSESRYLVERVQFRQRVADQIETRMYLPLRRTFDRTGVAARGLQNGSIHRYLGYSFLALVVVLVAVSW